jgi:hypothetical protein
MRRNLLLPVLLAVSLAGSVGCGVKRAPILVANVGVGVAQSIEQVRDVTSKLEAAKVLPTAAALRLTEGLQAVNNELRPLPDLLRAIDAAQVAGVAEVGNVNKAVAILQSVSVSISSLLAGVPVEATTKALIDLVRAAQKITATVLTEVARLLPPPPPVPVP